LYGRKSKYNLACKKVWRFKSSLPSENDIVVLIQDAVLRAPNKNWYLCKEDVSARGLKVQEEFLLSWEDISKLILKAKNVVVW
jgi:sulfur transfer complex TusBCD TusB component (DsrH family)